MGWKSVCAARDHTETPFGSHISSQRVTRSKAAVVWQHRLPCACGDKRSPIVSVDVAGELTAPT
eukprot:5450832-Amphidinium_carterae.1